MAHYHIKSACSRTNCPLRSHLAADSGRYVTGIDITSMTSILRLQSSIVSTSSLLIRPLAVIGMVILLSGFTGTDVEFNSMDVPPSKFKIRLAKQKGLPAPEGTPGLPVKAFLTKPGGKGPFPAVVMFPNGGGWPNTPRHWRERLNTWGYVTLEVGDVNEVPDYIEPLIQVLDAIGALQYMQQVPYVDSNRVAVMGWDQGAETALWAIEASTWAGSIGAGSWLLSQSTSALVNSSRLP